MDAMATPVAVSRKLRDGRSVTIRPVRPDDDSLERDFIRRLSSESRYLRFFKWVHSPSDRLVHFLTHADPKREVALVAVSRDRGEDEVVGEARFAILPEATNCELGIVIADNWQKSGLAGVLMETLLQAARDRGLKRMEGMVIATNRPMLKFVRALGFRVEPFAPDRTLVRIVKDLT